MKIIVDKMPEKKEDCKRYETRRNADGNSWGGCKDGTYACHGVEECPFYIGLEKALRGMSGLTIAQVPAAHAYWEKRLGGYDSSWVECSHCHSTMTYPGAKYCPSCGSVMESYNA